MIIVAVKFSRALHIEEPFTPNDEFMHYVKEFVNLHLSEDFARAEELIKTRQGQKKLRYWESKRNLIMKKIMVYKNSNTGKYSWYKNWFERVEIFQALQVEFFKNNLVVKDDPLATNEQVESLLRYHRPFTSNEQMEFKKYETQRLVEKFSKEFTSLKVDSMVDSNDIHETDLGVVWYDPSLKKYHVIKPDIVQSLLQERYELLHKSFEGKHRSYLLYQEKLYRAERILANLERIKNNGDEKVKLLHDDLAYRKYLNLHEDFAKGNVFYGYKNRYDDPARKDYGFEITAEKILGQRYQPMRNLFNNMLDFKTKIINFKSCELKDLPLIDSYIEHFRMLTYVFSEGLFDSHQWFSIKTKKFSEKIYMVKQKNVRSNNPNDMFKVVDDFFKEAKMTSSSLVVDRSLNDKNRVFKRQIRQDALSMSWISRAEKLRRTTFFLDRVMNYVNSLGIVNLLSHPVLDLHDDNELKSTKKLIKQQSEYDNSQGRLKDSLDHNKESHSITDGLSSSIPSGSSDFGQFHHQRDHGSVDPRDVANQLDEIFNSIDSKTTINGGKNDKKSGYTMVDTNVYHSISLSTGGDSISSGHHYQQHNGNTDGGKHHSKIKHL